MTDFNMPGLDGLELAGELCATYPAAAIAIVSANLQDEIVTHAQAVNAAFVDKPVTEDGLSDFVLGAALRLRKLSA